MLRAVPQIRLEPTVDAKIVLVRRLGSFIQRLRRMVSPPLTKEMIQLDEELTKIESEFADYVNDLMADRLPRDPVYHEYDADMLDTP